MSEFNMTIQSGTTRVLHTAGKYCDRDIVVTAEGGSVDDRYDEGYDDGRIDGRDEGYGEGRKEQYDAFWDSFQQNGERTNYSYGFAGPGWNNNTFIPKYPIRAVGGASYMFSYCGLTEYDFVEKGIDIDFSGATVLTYLFRDCTGIVRVGAIDCTGCKDVNRPFYGSGIKTIDSFIVSEATIYDNTFANATKLENITVNGTIGTSISFIDSKALSNASVQSIIDCLKDLTGATAQTLTLHADVVGRMTAEQKAAITAKNWTLVY